MKTVRQNSVQILKLHYIDELLLKYPLSKIAASSVILAINFYKLRQVLPNQCYMLEKQAKSSVFVKRVDRQRIFNGEASSVFDINIEIWNNK